MPFAPPSSAVELLACWTAGGAVLVEQLRADVLVVVVGGGGGGGRKAMVKSFSGHSWCFGADLPKLCPEKLFTMAEKPW